MERPFSLDALQNLFLEWERTDGCYRAFWSQGLGGGKVTTYLSLQIRGKVAKSHCILGGLCTLDCHNQAFAVMSGVVGFKLCVLP